MFCVVKKSFRSFSSEVNICESSYICAEAGNFEFAWKP